MLGAWHTLTKRPEMATVIILWWLIITLSHVLVLGFLAEVGNTLVKVIVIAGCVLVSAQQDGGALVY